MGQYLIKLCALFLSLCSTRVEAFCLPWLLDSEPPGFYVTAFGGFNGGYNVNSSDIKTSRGYYCGINAGKKIYPNIRLEGDFIWQRNGVQGVSLGSLSLTHLKGTMNTESLMANLLFDLNFPFPGTPSIGAGIGYAFADLNWSGKFIQTTDHLIKEKDYKGSVHEKGLAWQIIANLNFFVCPSVKISAEYRFFKLEDKFSTYKLGLALSKFF
ncbi:MAG: outer membrane protein [Parachlamydiaceae bacterium]